MGKITFLQPGLYTSVQDLGRPGYAKWGVSPSGAMDLKAFQLANHLLHNPPEAGCLEITQTGPQIQFSDDTIVVFSGASTSVSQNDKSAKVVNHDWLYIKKGDRLKVGLLSKGMRSYMAIQGGFHTEMIFESRSQSLGITSMDRLVKGSIINYPPLQKATPPLSKVKPAFPWMQQEAIHVYAGPEFSSLHEEEKNLLFSTSYTISQLSNRMAIQLDQNLINKAEQILTSPVFPGTIQLTPSGKLIILMRDAQVTGGYPRILQVKEAHIDLLSQMSPGTKFSFKLIEI